MIKNDNDLKETNCIQFISMKETFESFVGNGMFWNFDDESSTTS